MCAKGNPSNNNEQLFLLKKTMLQLDFEKGLDTEA